MSISSRVRARSATSSSASGIGSDALGSRVRAMSLAALVRPVIGAMARRAIAMPPSNARAVPPSTPRMRKKRTRPIVWLTASCGLPYSMKPIT